MILIVLGESLVSVGLAAMATDPLINTPLIVGALAGLSASTAMWWAYFAGEDERAAHAHAQTKSARERADQGLLGFGLAHLIMIFGAIAIAAATKISLQGLLDPMPAFGAWLMAAGCALYLVGGSLFRWALGYASPWPRFGGAIVSAVVAPAGLYGSASVALAAIAIVIFGTLAFESLQEQAPAAARDQHRLTVS